MELEEIDINDFGKLIERIKEETPEVPVEEYLKQYDPHKHDVMDAAIRKKRKVVSDVFNDEGVKTGTKEDLVEVNRIPAPFQKDIVDKAAAFLAGNPVELDSNPKDKTGERMLAMLKKVWLDNKLDFRNQEIARIAKSETQVAEVWYRVPAEEGYWDGLSAAQFKLRFKVLSFGKGDSLYPVKNAMDDLIAYGRGYKGKMGKKEIEKFDLQTATVTYKGTKLGDKWEVKIEPNLTGKIGYIHGDQETPEWHDAQPMASRYEVSTSNHGDTNDKHGDPSVVVEGDIIQQDKKGEYGGQVFNVAQGGDAKYMAWDHVVDSIELEQKTLKSNIFYFTSTPEITLEQMKSLGVFSGTALKMFFLPAHMKASKAATGWYGEYMQRRINYLKAALATIDQTLKPAVSMAIIPRFTFFMPVNEAEMVDMINASKTGGVLSQETGVSLNPLVKDPETEIMKIKDDEKSQLSTAFDE